MGDYLWHLGSKNEIRRRFLEPSCHCRCVRGPIKRGVNLNGFKLRGVVQKNESCAHSRKAGSEALTGAHAGGVLSPLKRSIIREQHEQLDREAAAFFAAEAKNRTEARALQGATRRMPEREW
jgi:hypothetical protein